MKYLALIYADEALGDPDDLMDQYEAYFQEITTAGVYVGGEALEPVSTATSIRMRNGERQVTDGPFAETKEQLGGYFVLECETLDDAIKWASKIPSAKYGTVEVRPLMVFDEE
ncbi:YciI family protein [Halovulum sp. GXIMD14793]